MTLLSLLTRVTGTFVLLAATCLDAAAKDSPLTVIAPYVDNQAFLIGRLDVKQLPLSDLKPRIIEFLGQVAGDPSVPQQVEPVIDQAIQLREGFLNAGGQDVFLIVSVADIPYQPPFLVVTASDPQKLDAVESFARQLMGASANVLEIRKSGDRALLVGTPATLDRLAALKAEPRPEVLAAISAIADGTAPVAAGAQRRSASRAERDLPQFSGTLSAHHRAGIE